MLSKFYVLSATVAPFATLAGHVLTLIGVQPAAEILFTVACALTLIGEGSKWFCG